MKATALIGLAWCVLLGCGRNDPSAVTITIPTGYRGLLVIVQTSDPERTVARAPGGDVALDFSDAPIIYTVDDPFANWHVATARWDDASQLPFVYYLEDVPTGEAAACLLGAQHSSMSFLAVGTREDIERVGLATVSAIQQTRGIEPTVETVLARLRESGVMEPDGAP